jgi:hypothetical protein
MCARNSGESVNRLIASFLAALLALSGVFHVKAQGAETIWLSAVATAYKTGETVLVTVNASSATPIQGFTFQIRYDPSCLRPINASSPVPGMNGLPLPQLAGLVDGSYASTAPQIVNGVLAEVRFTALQGCQTGLYLESGALAIRNAEGFAAPLANVLIGERNIALNIDKEVVEQSLPPDTGSILPLDPPDVQSGFSGWIIGVVIAILIILGVFGAYKVLRVGSVNKTKVSKQSQKAALYVKEGSQSGKRFPLNKLPCQIGRDPQSDICINDPQVISRHATIHAVNDRYYLTDLGGGTFVNGHAVRRGSAVLMPGDVIRFGANTLFVFG